jgi:hypothetical protein
MAGDELRAANDRSPDVAEGGAPAQGRRLLLMMLSGVARLKA